MTQVAGEQIEIIVKEQIDKNYKSPLALGDDGQWYYLEGDDAQPLFDKSLLRFIEAAKAEDKLPPLNRFVGEWKYNDSFTRGDVVRYGNQLWVCWQSGDSIAIEDHFIALLNSTVIGGGAGGGGGTLWPANPLPGLAIAATDPQNGNHWIDGLGLIQTTNNTAETNAIAANPAGLGHGGLIFQRDINQYFSVNVNAAGIRSVAPILAQNPMGNVLTALEYNPATGRVEWRDITHIPFTVDTQADLSNRGVLPVSHLTTGKLVFVRDTGTLYEFISSRGTITNSIADWRPLITKVDHYARIGNLPAPATAVPPLQDGQLAYVDFDINAAPYGRLFLYDLANTRWNPVNTKVWVKTLRLNPDQATDQNIGDFMVNTENLHKELKSYDGTAWQTIYSEDNVKAWIAAGSQFRGTVENAGFGVIGALSLTQLPVTSGLNANNKGWYWTFVGQSGYVIQVNDVGGAPSSIDGARMSVGDWIQVAEITPPIYNIPNDVTSGVLTPAVYAYVHIPGDLLSKSRGDGLYGLNNWTPGAYEIGSLVVMNGDVWKASTAVVLNDREPGFIAAPIVATVSAVQVGKNYTIAITGGPVAAAGVINIAFDIATTPGPENLAVQLTAGMTATQVANAIVAQWVNPNTTATKLVGADNVSIQVVDPALDTITVLQTTIPPINSPWVKVNIAGGVRKVSSDIDRPTVGVNNGDVYLVLSSAEAGGKQALYSWDAGSASWIPLGGGGIPLDLSGGKQIQSIGVPVGTVIMWAGQTLPPSYLLCDGSTFNAVTFPTLNTVLGGNKLPDMRGMFVKGGAAPNFVQQNYKTALPTGSAFVTSTEGNHVHGGGSLPGNRDYGTYTAGTNNRLDGPIYQNTQPSGNHAHSVVGGDNVTEPKHVVLVYCIKGDDIGMSTIN
jgi:hypothetical protein